MELTIIRHGVPIEHREGDTVALSPLQRQLLTSDKPVRIAQAPTGAGKSFAFRQAVLRKQRVLFIVPTKRLVQNVAHDMRAALQETGLNDVQINRRVAIWSKDQTDALKAEDEHANVTAIRMNQAQQLAPFGKGDMIIAVPEVVSFLLADPRRKLMTGHSRFSLFDLLNFNHVVFDEFHTIEPRGFGMAALFAYLAAKLRPRFPLQVSFLSATPINIQPVLEHFGVPNDLIDKLNEGIEEGDFDQNHCRTIHGDVRLSFESHTNLLETIQAHLPEIKQQLAEWETDKQQVIIIYDALIDLRQQRFELENLFAKNGISPLECLLINSIEDSSDEYLEPGRFAGGRNLNPFDFKVLIATASVELGVTFNANLLFMEPGFSPLNFLQRYGRAARGQVNGQVIVRIDDKLLSRRPWLLMLLNWAKDQQGQIVSIRELTHTLTARTCKLFEQKIITPESAEAETDPSQLQDYFDQMPSQAVYTAGLYWHVVEQHPAFKKTYQGKQLEEQRPKVARQIYKLLRRVEKLKQFSVPDVQDAAERWCQHFRQEVLRLRNIGRTVEVTEESSGRRLQVREHWLATYTHILERFPVQIDEWGKFKVTVPGGLDDFLRLQKQYEIKTVTVWFPHTITKPPLSDDYQLVKHWCDALYDARLCDDLEDIEAEMPETLKAAEILTRITGIVISEETIANIQNTVI